MEEGKEIKRENNDIKFIFVYGTLRVGGVNNYKLDELWAEYIGSYKSLNKYTMYGLKSKSYPVIVKNINGINIYGDLYKLEHKSLHTLDILEGHPNQYTRIMDNFTNGEHTLGAYIYVCNNDHVISEIEKSNRFVEINSGNWVTWCAEKN